MSPPWDASALCAAYGGEAWHLTSPQAVPLIRRHGLLSAAALVALFEVPAAEATPLLQDQRSQFVTLRHPVHGEATLRRQQMWDSKLGPALAGSGVTPTAWRQHINAHVFFWLDKSRAESLAGADPKRPQILLRMDLRKLLERHQGRAWLTPINMGAVRHPSHRRSLADWYRVGDYRDSKRRKLAELAIEGSVPEPDIVLD